PGKTPYENFRPLKVPQKYDGVQFLDFVSCIFSHVPRDYWAREFEFGRFLINDHKFVASDRRVNAGERYLQLTLQTSEHDVNTHIKILYEDDALIVLDKPAPLPVHPSGRFNRNTLQWILNEVYHPLIPRPAHRLDANTTGVIVFARSKHFATLLQPQFA